MIVKLLICRVLLSEFLQNSMQHLYVALAQVQNTPTASLQKGKTLPTSVLVMTLNNLMVRRLGNTEYPFIAIAPMLARNKSIC